MEPRGNSAGGKYAAAPPVRTSEPACSVWWLLAGTNYEGSTLQVSVLTFCKTKGDMDMKKLFFAATLISLSGCATQAVLPEQAEQAPQNRVLKYQDKTTDKNATLIVVRDSGYLGSGCFTGVYLNDEKAAILNPAEKAIFHLKPGEWSVAIKGEGKLCISDSVPVGNYVNLKDGETKAVRLFADPSGNVDVKPLPLK